MVVAYVMPVQYVIFCIEYSIMVRCMECETVKCFVTMLTTSDLKDHMEDDLWAM